MCLILVGWRVHPEYPLVMAANRDEFHERPTAAADWWRDRPSILAGRDLQAGGTWLGVARNGTVAALTNYRDPARIRPGAPSRGGLVVQMLESSAPIPERLGQIQSMSARYADFNLIVSDGTALGVYESVPAAGRLLEPGIYGLSNHLLDTPWPKVQRAKSQLALAIGSLPSEDGLRDLLRDDRRPRDEELPRTGVSLEFERLLSSAFIIGDSYGTRSSTVLLLDRSGELSLREWTWLEDGSLGSEVQHRFLTSMQL